MTAEEFFIEQFNKCIWVEDIEITGNIYMLFDKHHERKIKMNSILGNKNKIEFIKTEDTVVLFYQDHKNGYLYCNCDKIWSVFEEEYSLKYNEIKELIKGILNDDTKLKLLTPQTQPLLCRNLLNDDTKLKLLTPDWIEIYDTTALDDDTKLKLLTPGTFYN